jgi:hypothetical protein
MYLLPDRPRDRSPARRHLTRRRSSQMTSAQACYQGVSPRWTDLRPFGEFLVSSVRPGEMPIP